MSLFYYYFLLINSISFVARGIDKRKAVNQQWRIAEKYLLVLVALGGFVGAIIGMQLFHHKTVKGTFLLRFWLIVGIWIVFSFILLTRQ